MKKFVLAAFLLAAPLAARAEIGLRIGPEVSLFYHDGAGTHFLSDNFPVAGNLMLSYWTPGQLISIDLEVAEQFYFKDVPGNLSNRLGTVLRPGVRVSPPAIPLYLRAALPIRVEAPSPYGTGDVSLRLGAGLTVPLVLFGLYIEGDVETPLGGNNTKAFDTWQFVASGGLDFRF